MKTNRISKGLHRIHRCFSTFYHAPEFFDDIYHHLNQLHQSTDSWRSQSDDLESRVQNLESIDPEFYYRFLEKLYHDEIELKRLNKEQSIVPTIWGEPSRLHISSLASVSSCFFNTNSGNISIGDYSFAGSGVSVLAGGHDKNLFGFLRRDAELTEGCDIVIGSGVWLASGCIVLGPCRIGDDAVIAAGAVVTPGSTVPAGSIYGGIPAKEIGRVRQAEDPIYNNAVINALKRNEGILFLKGWSDKKQYPGMNGLGHFLSSREGLILTDRNKWCIHYALRSHKEAEFDLSGSFGIKHVLLKEGTGCLNISFDLPEGKAETVMFKSLTDDVELFLQIL